MGFSPVSSPLVPGIIRYIFYLHSVHRGTGTCFSLQLSYLGVPGEASQRTCKRSPPTAGVEAQERAGRSLRLSVRFRIVLCLAQYSPSLGSATRNEKTRVTDLLKFFCHILAVPTPPAPPSSVSECANKDFQASVGKREGKADVKAGRGGGTTEAREDRGPTDES